MISAAEAAHRAYECAALHDQKSQAYSYWMGVAHTFKIYPNQNSIFDLKQDWFKLPPYIPAEPLKAVK